MGARSRKKLLTGHGSRKKSQVVIFHLYTRAEAPMNRFELKFAWRVISQLNRVCKVSKWNFRVAILQGSRIYHCTIDFCMGLQQCSANAQTPVRTRLPARLTWPLLWQPIYNGL